VSRKIYGIIPARGGSKGVPKKNIRPLAGYPLIAYSISAAKLCPRIDRIIVSTDSEEIAEIGRRYGAEVPFMRPAGLASDRSSDRDFVMHALGWFNQHENSVPEYLVHLRPTTPLRDPVLVADAIDALVSNPEATSLRSGHEAPESPFKWFLRDGKGYFCGFNPGDPRPGYSNLPRQSFPVVYVPDGYVDVLRTAFVLNSDDIHGKLIMGYVSPMCQEIDTLEDWEFLEFQLTKQNSLLLDSLKSNYPQEV
jgi:CMP-N,N'-diacetyllegionaminic acid synthase